MIPTNHSYFIIYGIISFIRFRHAYSEFMTWVCIFEIFYIMVFIVFDVLIKFLYLFCSNESFFIDHSCFNLLSSFSLLFSFSVFYYLLLLMLLFQISELISII